MPQAIQGPVLVPPSYQGNPQQQASAALASSSPAMEEDSIAPAVIGVTAGGLLTAVAVTLAVKHFSTSGDKPETAQATSSKSVERTEATRIDSAPESNEGTPLPPPPHRESTPVVTREIPPPQFALSLQPALPEKIPEPSRPKTTLTSLPVELLQKIFSHALYAFDDLDIRGSVKSRYDKAKIKLVNKQMAGAVCGYERKMCLEYIEQLRKNREFPSDDNDRRRDHGALILNLQYGITDNIPHFTGDKAKDGAIESGVNDLVDLYIEMKFGFRQNVKWLREDLGEISNQLKKKGYNNEFVSKKLYLHDLSVFVNYIKESWNDRYLDIFNYKNDHRQAMRWINRAAKHYLKGISPENEHAAINDFLTVPEHPNAQDLDVGINFAKGLLDGIPNHFTTAEKSEAFDKLEDAFKTLYNRIDRAQDDRTTWEDNEFGASLRRARAAIRPL